MDKNSILSKISGNPKNLPLEKLKNPAYCFPKSVAKHSGQNLPSEKHEIPSRILSGFFYACDKIRWVMTDCMEEPSGSPFSLCNGKANSVQSVTLQFALKLTVSQTHEETAYNV